MKKAQIVIMSILTLILIAITVFVVILTNKLDKMVDEEIHQEVVIEDEESSVDMETVDALQDSFDALFSWEDIENLYEGQTDFWFVEVQNVDEE